MTIMTSAIVLNTTLSLIFVGYLKIGTFGAGLGTGISYTSGAVVYAVYFFLTLKRNREMDMAKGRFSLKTLWHICYNGSPEGLTELAVAVVTFLFNGFNIFAASYFTAIDRPDLSLLIAAIIIIRQHKQMKYTQI